MEIRIERDEYGYLFLHIEARKYKDEEQILKDWHNQIIKHLSKLKLEKKENGTNNI